jgi:molecular chaperone DnaK
MGVRNTLNPSFVKMGTILKTQYFIKNDVSIYGPFSAAQVIQLVKTNQVMETDSVSGKLEGPWVNAGSVKQLQPFFGREKDVEPPVLKGLADDVPMSGDYLIAVERIDDLDLPVEKLQQIYKLTASPVQWLNNGVYMFSTPKNITAVSVDGEYVFFEDSLAGAPFAEIELSQQVHMGWENKIIGIDLGTTHSVVAVMEGDKPKIIPSAEGNRLTPSVVAYVDGAKIHIGEPAQRQAVTNPTRTIRLIKRLMGRRLIEITHNKGPVSYKVGENDCGYVEINVDDNWYSPQEISAKILRKLKASAEAYLGHNVNKAVITVPAYFNDSQRQATRDAAHMAGLDLARIINEPTAAALAYGLGKKQSERFIVFDLGGGSCDVSVLEMQQAGDSDNESQVFEVLSTAGNTQLGGSDFDVALLNHVADVFQSENSVDLRNDTTALQRLYDACEKAKKELSSISQTDINLPFIITDETGPKHMQMTIIRSTFEKIIESLVDKCREPLQRALEDAGFATSDIDEVVLVGGSTRIPKVRDMVVNLFGKEPHQGVNPDEVVAMGAAIQGSVLAGDRTDVLLLDVTPFTVGIETEGGMMTILVKRNSTLPVEKKSVFSTVADNQACVTLKVFQGELEMAKDNRLLGEFKLDGIPPAQRGVPQIEVTFDLDQDGILNVTAKDLGTKKQSNIRIEDSAGRIH